MSDSRAERQAAPTHPSRPAGAKALARSTPDDAFIGFAYAVLQHETAAFAAARPRATSPTPDEVHRLRVAARRLRVALRLFTRMLPRTDVRRYRDDLKWFATSLGEVRDLDVYLQSFEAHMRTLPAAKRRALGGYQLHLRRERKAARRKAAEAAASPRAAALFRDLESFVAAGPARAARRKWSSLSTRAAIRQAVRRSVGRVRRLGNALTIRATPVELHKLRIQTKRLRYELEFFSTVYPALQETANACRAIQDVLGGHQDAYTATARLRRYAASLSKADSVSKPPLAELRKNQLEAARKLRRSFRATWPSFAATIGAARKLVA